MAIGTFMGYSSTVANIMNSKKRPDSGQQIQEAMYSSCLQALSSGRDKAYYSNIIFVLIPEQR
jgi:hypothetical protein